MRVAHVISSDAGIGGAERVVAWLTSEGSKRGEHHEIFRPFARDETARPLADLAGVGVTSARGAGRGLLRGARSTIASIASFDADVVHTHLFHAEMLLPVLPRRPVRLLTHHHGDAFEVLGQRRRVLAERVMARRFDKVVAISGHVEEFVRSRLGVPAEKIVTIPNGWSGSPVPGPRTGNLVLSVGNLRREKGHDSLIRAMASVQTARPGTRVRLVGDGPERRALERLAAEIGTEVEFVGTTSDVWSQLGNADVYVQPSRTEQFGIAVIEAMAAGLPVVATTVGGLPELVSTATGVLVPPDRPDRIAAAVLNLLEGPSTRRAALGSAASAIADQYHANRMTERYFALYEELIGQ